jgi:sec-independent protein translocase protein TatC
MADKNNPENVSLDDTEQPFISHLVELRDRLLRVVLAVAVVFLVLFPFSNTLFTALSGPLMAHMPEDSSMIAIEVASPFLIPFKLTLFLALFIAIPFVLYQLWSFIAPGLYRHERRLVFPLLVSSTVLFYAGAAFAYFVVFPLVFAFFTSTAPEGVSVMTDISRYLDFVLTLFFAFGAAFEVPVVTVLLVWTGMVTQDQLREKRPYIIVGAFVIGMLLTPPDVISQTLLAVPVWLLFELGVYFSGWFTRRADKAGASRNDKYQPMSEAEMDAELDRIEAEDKDS